MTTAIRDSLLTVLGVSVTAVVIGCAIIGLAFILSISNSDSRY